MQKNHNKLIIILGPTCSGKSKLALKLCQEFSGEIVSADSRQIYSEMDIGTAKNSGISSEIKTHLIDVVSPDKVLTLAQYKKLAVAKIKHIQSLGKLPFLVGGTGLYIQAIVDNLQIPKVKPNYALRKRLNQKPINELLEFLKKIASGKFADLNNSDRNNKRRVIRAIEIALSGKPFGSKKRPVFDCLQIGIKTNMQDLYKKIDKRVDLMLENGLVDEVELLSQKYDWSLVSMSGIGYAEFRDFFDNKQTLNKTVSLIKTHTRQYARKQMMWFKRDKRILWIRNYSSAKKSIRIFLET